MTDTILGEPDGATPLADISGLLRHDITTGSQLDEAESYIAALRHADDGSLQLLVEYLEALNPGRQARP